MTTKADYTDEEWVGIVRAPILAGGYIAVSDMSTLGIFGEMKGLYEAITGHPVPDAAAGLVTAVVAAIKATEGSKDKLPMPQTQNSEKQAAQLLNQLGLDLEALDREGRTGREQGLQGLGPRHRPGDGRGIPGGRLPRHRGRPGEREGGRRARHPPEGDGAVLSASAGDPPA